MKIIIKYIIIFFILLIPVSLFFYGFYKIDAPYSEQQNSQPTEQLYDVTNGDGVFDIGPKLEKAGLISSRFWFYSYVLAKGWGAKLQAGQYLLSTTMSVAEIASKLANGDVVMSKTDVTVTFYEGYNTAQMDKALADLGLIAPNELINFNLGTLDKSKFDFEIQSLEGYLFPDTYRLAPDAEISEIVAKMLKNFQNKLTPDLRAEIAKQNKTINEIVIMASLLEKEVRTENDRKIVSGIFWQRLADKYPLQACSTIAYILGADKWRYSIADTQVDSKYNTYKYSGLPPTAICNPGIDSIEAAINPIETDYYFFLSKPTGETVFSKTLEEHNQNIAKYL